MNAKLRAAACLLGAVSIFLLVRSVVGAVDPPEHNWDMLPYMALALSWEMDDSIEVHREVYRSAARELPEESYRRLIRGRVRSRRAKDPAAFTEHLAFYRSRVLYTALLYGLHKAGAPLTAATVWVSLIAYVLLALLVFWWAARFLPWCLALPFAAAVLLVPDTVRLAGLSTADSLATTLVCLGVYWLVERRSLVGAALFLTASLTARLDSVLFIGALLVFLFLFDKPARGASKGLLATWAALSLGVFLTLKAYGGDYGWWVLFTIVFVQRAIHPSRLARAIDFSVYWDVLREQAAAAVLSWAPVYFGLGLGGAIAGWRLRSPSVQRYGLVLVALLATYLARFLLFPQVWPRLLATFYVLVPLLLLSMAQTLRRERSTAE